jgi:WD40 repeat protein
MGSTALVDTSDFTVTRVVEGRAPSLASPLAPDGARFATVSGDGRVRVVDLGGDRPPLTLDAHRRIVLATAFSSDGERLATADIAGNVRIWDPSREDAPLLSLSTPGLGAATSIAFTPDGASVIVGYSTGALRIHPITSRAAMVRACGVLAWLHIPETDGHCAGMFGP